MKPLFETDLVERVIAILDESDMAYKDFGLDSHNPNSAENFYKIRFENAQYIEIFADKIRFTIGTVNVTYDVDEEDEFVYDLNDAVSLIKDGKLPMFDPNGDFGVVEDREDCYDD